jgi:hypothetical protein
MRPEPAKSAAVLRQSRACDANSPLRETCVFRKEIGWLITDEPTDLAFRIIPGQEALAFDTKLPRHRLLGPAIALRLWLVFDVQPSNRKAERQWS